MAIGIDSFNEGLKYYVIFWGMIGFFGWILYVK